MIFYNGGRQEQVDLKQLSSSLEVTIKEIKACEKAWLKLLFLLSYIISGSDT